MEIREKGFGNGKGGDNKMKEIKGMANEEKRNRK